VSDDAAPAGAATDGASAEVAPGVSSSERTAFFGDLHVHTRNSYDAFVFGTRADPDAAYEFAKGNAITHPAGFELQLDRPLDFQMVADHANYLGMLPAMTDPDSPAYDHPVAETVRTALWSTRTPTATDGFPITYAVDGRQYLAVPSGPGWSLAWANARRAFPNTMQRPPGSGSVLQVFALPEE
jgi:hypothetical protein